MKFWLNEARIFSKVPLPDRDYVALTCIFTAAYLILSAITHVSAHFLNVPFEIRPRDLGDVAGVIFGVTSGVLTLTGLIAIFVSLNVQHRVEKCRELHWGMLDVQHSEETTDCQTTSRKILKELRAYTAISSVPFLDKVIQVTLQAILIVLGIWVAFGGLFIENNRVENILVFMTMLIAIYILARFYSIIKDLDDPKKAGRLTAVEDLFDADYKHKNEEDAIEVLLVAACNVSLHIPWNLRKDDDLSPRKLVLQMKVPVNNIAVKVINVTFDDMFYSLDQDSVEQKIAWNTIEHKDYIASWIREQHVNKFCLLKMYPGQNRNQVKIVNDSKEAWIPQGAHLNGYTLRVQSLSNNQRYEVVWDLGSTVPYVSKCI